uniref:CCT domain-containing protein n=1 Tax=Oryza punctata TaxID=4537 RepID=A0A0E0MBF1_ORYPU
MHHSSRSSSWHGISGRSSSPPFHFLQGRYSAEERRERIEKYRSKRSHRNFGKRITYACRKRLADERARVKGRFVSSSGGNDNYAPAHQLPPSLVNLSNGAAAAIIPRSVPEWWPEMQASLARDEMSMMCGGAGMNLHLCDANEMEQVAAYVGVSSMDLCAYLHCSWPPV